MTFVLLVGFWHVAIIDGLVGYHVVFLGTAMSKKAVWTAFCQRRYHEMKLFLSSVSKQKNEFQLISDVCGTLSTSRKIAELEAHLCNSNSMLIDGSVLSITFAPVFSAFTFAIPTSPSHSFLKSSTCTVLDSERVKA